MGAFEFFDHTADIGLRVWGDSFADLLVNAAQGLTCQIAPNTEAIHKVEHRTIVLTGEQKEWLLFDLLREMIFLFEVDHLVFREVHVAESTPGELVVTLYGEQYNNHRHGAGHEVKAVTYHGLQVEKTDEHWSAEVIFDI